MEVCPLGIVSGLEKRDLNNILVTLYTTLQGWDSKTRLHYGVMTLRLVGGLTACGVRPFQQSYSANASMVGFTLRPDQSMTVRPSSFKVDLI